MFLYALFFLRFEADSIFSIYFCEKIVQVVYEVISTVTKK